MVAGEWIPILAILVTGVLIGLGMYFKNQRVRYSGTGDYRKLAEEATRGQKALLEQMRQMNESLQEIERLLREV